MAMLSGVRDFFISDSSYKYAIRSGLDLIAVAEAHVLWKTRLGHHVQGNIREPLELSQVGQGGVCQLENWLNSLTLEPFHGTGVYNQLNEAHQQFHQLGALIVEKLKAGDHAGAATVFKCEYNQSLLRIIQSLTEINRHLRD
ncbi:MAG: hypothetical protein EPN14_00190 [Gallionella sp.]|nr:MAG: hypothetical protein EPN14_00190 [Gallionella sp.]